MPFEKIGIFTGIILALSAGDRETWQYSIDRQARQALLGGRMNGDGALRPSARHKGSDCRTKIIMELYK